MPSKDIVLDWYEMVVGAHVGALQQSPEGLNLNPIEHWFNTLQRHVLARGSFAAAGALRKPPGRYVRSRNRWAVSPQWNTTTDELLVRIAQIRRTYNMVHQARQDPP